MLPVLHLKMGILVSVSRSFQRHKWANHCKVLATIIIKKMFSDPVCF